MHLKSNKLSPVCPGDWVAGVPPTHFESQLYLLSIKQKLNLIWKTIALKSVVFMN